MIISILSPLSKCNTLSSFPSLLSKCSNLSLPIQKEKKAHLEGRIDELSSKLGDCLGTIKKKDDNIAELQNKSRDLKKLVAANQHEAEAKSSQLEAKIK